ncbi:MAG TPA: DNA methyltransferase [Candidatus Hodarchaeales archaeon]|nr:DNA methyltransferase [Candidatus Hodarchaeales archaeon]
MEDYIEVPIDQIIVKDDDRQRKELEDGKISGATIAELAESIKLRGLINPIVIYRDNTLATGRRRIEAFKLLGRSTIPTRIFETLPLLERKELEFDENHKRKQLTWQEEVQAIQEIHSLREVSAKESGEEWSTRKTAEALGLSVGKVSEDLMLANFTSNERVVGRPSRRGAITTAKRERELELLRELAKRRSQELGITPAENSTTFGSGIIHNADCRDILKTMEPDSVDLIFMDPPWAIDFEHSSQWTSKWVASYDDTVGHVRPMLLEVFPLLFKVMKPASHFYCFFPAQELEWWITQLTKVGFHVRQRPLIWFKTGQPSISDPYSTFLSTYETFIWGAKPDPDGVRRLLSRATPEGLGISRQPGLWHENEKPVELVETYIEASSVVNEIVFDPFSGGGSTLVAAFNTGRYFIGVEGDPGNYEKIRRRLTELETSKEVIEE